MTYEYLWNEVRVKGGAYGSGCNVNNMKEACFHSYCDPTPEKSIGIFENTVKFISKYCSENPDISSYIISSITSGEPLVSDAEYATAADSMYFRNITQESRRKLREEILEMTSERIADVYNDLKNELYFCAVCSKETVDEVVENNCNRDFTIETVY